MEPRRTKSENARISDYHELSSKNGDGPGPSLLDEAERGVRVSNFVNYQKKIERTYEVLPTSTLVIPDIIQYVAILHPRRDESNPRLKSFVFDLAQSNKTEDVRMIDILPENYFSIKILWMIFDQRKRI